MNVTLWPLERIIPFARNARKIPPQAVDKVAASIKEFGWRVPIVVDRDGVIICGHTRLLAAYKLGLKEAPAHVADNLTPSGSSRVKADFQGTGVIVRPPPRLQATPAAKGGAPSRPAG
jgi:hypothetical protein